MAYRNHEGYSDPTAGQALANIAREERAKRKGVYVERYTAPARRNQYPVRRSKADVTKEVTK